MDTAALTAALTAATKRYRKAEEALDAARSQLQDAALQAMADGMKQAEVSRITGWTRETLRKLKPKADPAG